ncbi:interleukin 17 receptor A1a isoform X2 [Amia ocellicauda]|uniref:interleukin 17 receptor A1a isoform X2 n=1 Tax=Amia ocellicauda TaxID=2972642 RepID=UPI003464B2BD
MIYLLYYSLGWMSVSATFTTDIRILEWPAMRCTQKGLDCIPKISNCLHSSWFIQSNWTPTSPLWNSDPKVDVRTDENGNEVPVIVISWRARQDGSITVLNGTEVEVLQVSNNNRICVQYIYLNKIQNQLNPDGDPWTFSLDRVVVEPEQTYVISLSSLPYKNVGSEHDNIEKTVTIPGCTDIKMQRTKVCQLRGSLWKPNITFTASNTEASVQFNTGDYSEKYVVILVCSQGKQEHKESWKGNQTSLNVKFPLTAWPETCCDFSVTVQPFFHGCEHDCTRHQRKFDVCEPFTKQEDGPPKTKDFPYWTIAVFGGMVFFSVSCIVLALHRRRQREKSTGKISLLDHTREPLNPETPPSPHRGPRKVLILYSLDHPLYKQVVLKLYAFLKAECGIEVILDLLDTTWLGIVGRMQWLDWQKQQIEKSSDKILILCSRGVRAKWEAMCGSARLMLKEDAYSSMGDMLTPALNLIIPDFLVSASFGKYIVAYFDDVSSEEDIPRPFHITIKYKLMKHFEEIYFRILDKEKHEPGKINRVEGISEDEYFRRPCGKALRDAIEAFQAYQMANPDWFARECVANEEELTEADPDVSNYAEINANSVLQCVPQYRQGPPILINEVDILEDTGGVYTVNPLVHDQGGSIFSHMVLPSVHQENCQVLMSQPTIQDAPGILRVEVHPSALEGHGCLVAEPAINEPMMPQRNELRPPQEPAAEDYPLQSQEEAQGSIHLSAAVFKSLQALQQAYGPSVDPTVPSVEEEFELEEQNNPHIGLYTETRPLSGSDQGYISRSSLMQDVTSGGNSCDPLSELRKLQEECYLNSLTQ